MGAKGRKAEREALIKWWNRMQEAWETMSPEQRAELQTWEDQNLDGHSIGTSDWPGWEPLIGPKP